MNYLEEIINSCEYVVQESKHVKIKEEKMVDFIRPIHKKLIEKLKTTNLK